MPIDSSIYSNIKGPQQLDIGSLINTARAAQQLQGESSLGDIYKQATNPDGSIDAGKLGTLAPSAGVLAPQVAAQAQERQQGQQAIDRNKLDNLREWWKTLDAELYSHMNDPDLSHRKVLDSIHDLIGHKNSVLNGGIFTPQLATQASKWLWGPDGQPLPADKIRQKLGPFHTRVLGALNASEPIGYGVAQPGNPWGLAPGTPVTMTRGGGVTYDANLPRGGAYGAPGAAGGGAPGGAPRGAMAAPGGGASAMPGAGVPAIPGGLPPGFSEAASGIGSQSARAANALTDANDTSMVRKGMLGNLEEDLNHFTAGPGADWTKFAKAWVNRNVPLPTNWQFDPKSIASQEQFNKQAAMLAQSQFAAIGGTGTDAKFESAFTTSPNEALSQLGNKGIIRLLKGNEDAIQAKNRAWQEWLRAGNGPQTYAQFSHEFNSHFDPRSFQFKYLGQGKPKKEADADRQAYVDRMEPGERERFLGDLVSAHQRGWIKFDVPTSPAKGQKSSALSAPPVPSAKIGKDVSGNDAWFIPDTSRPGKFKQVMMG
jgi:hypothetical protein